MSFPYEVPDGMHSGIPQGMPNDGMADPVLDNVGLTDDVMYEEGPPPPMYNLQPPMGMSVTTPATVPQAYQSAQAVPKTPNLFIGSGTKGPDPLFRVQMGLKSGVQSEADWCLTTLLTFTTAHNSDLLRTRIDILNLVIDYINSHWSTVTSSRTEMDDNYSALLARQKVLEALLIMRNVCIDQTTAAVLAPRCASFVEAGVKLPALPQYHEMRLLCLEVCEHVCFLPAQHNSDSGSENLNTSNSSLFVSLVELLAVSQDKSVLLSALRSVSRLLVFDSHETSPLLQFPTSVARITKFLVVDDAELQACGLEFLQQFTARLQKVDQLTVAAEQPNLLARQLVRLLCFRMEREATDYLRLPRRTRKLAPVVPPTIPPALMQTLLRLPEPDRATAWIRASYDLDPEGEVLQVSLWTAYQRLFEPHERDGTGHRLLKAIDFIRTCTTNVRGAQAKVVSTPEGPKKFIIKGLVPRETALSLDPTPDQQEGSSTRPPPVFGSVAAACLLNIVRLQGGKQLLEPLIADITQSACVNPAIFERVDLVLAEIAA